MSAKDSEGPGVWLDLRPLNADILVIHSFIITENYQYLLTENNLQWGF